MMRTMNPSAVVTIGMFMHGGWLGLKSHVENGGRLPFSLDWFHPFENVIIRDEAVVSIMQSLVRLRNL